MTIKSINDNGIIKALECCVSSTTSEACEGCPFNENDICDKDSNATEKYALDLINRQKAEKEQLNHKYELAVAEREANVKGFTEQLKTARAEAITEFAERLKKYYNRLDNSQGNLISFHIDQIAKEMKGANNA